MFCSGRFTGTVLLKAPFIRYTAQSRNAEAHSSVLIGVAVHGKRRLVRQLPQTAPRRHGVRPARRCTSAVQGAGWERFQMPVNFSWHTSPCQTELPRRSGNASKRYPTRLSVPCGARSSLVARSHRSFLDSEVQGP